jgi:hypothetical protein
MSSKDTHFIEISVKDEEKATTKVSGPDPVFNQSFTLCVRLLFYLPYLRS